MKDINNSKYAKILKLIQSSNREDIHLGMVLAVREFNTEELLYNFPNTGKERNIETQIPGDIIWGVAKECILCVTDQAFAFPTEGELEDWRRIFKDKEIQL